MTQQYHFDLDQINKKIEALQTELRLLLKQRRQIKKTKYLYEWRKKLKEKNFIKKIDK